MPTGELQIMARYARLKELGFDTDDSELFEVGELDVDFIDKLTEGDAVPVPGDSAEAERAQQQKSIRGHLYTVPSTELASEIFSQLQNSKGYGLAQQQQQQKLQEQHNIENGNPNVCLHDAATQPTAVAICSHSSTATGASLQEQQPHGGGIGRGGASHSGRWVGRKIEERSSRCRTMGCESYHSDNSSSVLDDVNINSSAPSSRPTCGQWTPSIQRGSSHRDGEQPALGHYSQEPGSSRVGTQPQHQEKQSRLHSSRIDIRNSQRTQRSSKESSLRESQSNAPIPGAEKRSLPSVMHPRSDASSCGSVTEERDPIFQRSSSAKEAASGLQRSSSTVQRSETSTENWRDHPASKSAHVSDRTKHRVSFSLTEDHEVETQKLREKFREPITQCKKVLQAKQQQQTTTNKQPLRYNYEQPGFVEREKENICAGKAYTIYGVKDAKDCPKGPSSHQLVRAFSLREKNGSNYTKMPRAYSVNAGGGRHLMPMECDTCGKGGIGIVFLGLPGDDANSCKACGCGESKPPKKKKSIMDYCRKILRLTPKPR